MTGQMDEETLKEVAGQLRQPSGELGIKVGEKMNEGNALMNLAAIELVHPTAGDHILEIGMGNGYFVKDIVSKDHSIKYAGIDYSGLMIDEANKHNESFIHNGQAMFFHGEADNMPFEDNSFNKVFTVNTVYFWETPRLVLAEISRVLKPGGDLIIVVRPKSVMQYYPFVKYGFTMFDDKELADLLTSNNFIVCDIVEKDEPEFEFASEKMRAKILMVRARKP